MTIPLAVKAQYFLPKTLLTMGAGKLAGIEGGALTHSVIRWFVARYGVNMSEARDPAIESYKSFNEFFTRPLRDGARPLHPEGLLCPVDGAISQFGAIEGDQIFQAKGHRYSTQALVGGDAVLAKQFENGSFATVYLSPKDYHRIHMPCTGVLKQMIYVPGDLFSVNPATAQGVPGLFARNERVVCVFDTEFGPFVNVLVGATIVGSMATVWHGLVNPPRYGSVKTWSYADSPVSLARGAEMGRFLLGSTVVMLFAKDAIEFNPEWQPSGVVRMGEQMGTGKELRV